MIKETSGVSNFLSIKSTVAAGQRSGLLPQLCRKGVIFLTEELRNILKAYAQKIHELLGESLTDIILYGSYARGEATPESDVNILILANLSESRIHELEPEIMLYTYEVNVANNILIHPLIKPYKLYHFWSSVHPLYQKIDSEGVKFY